jgi:hypothetical protein
MTTINVKAKEGRVAFYEGREIPTDKFVPVTNDAYIQRLIHHWGDLEVEGGTEEGPIVNPQRRQSSVEKGPSYPVSPGGRRPQRSQPTGTDAPGLHLPNNE